MTEERRRDDERLKRVEDKIDKLTEAMLNLVRLETNQQNLATRVGRVEERQDKIEEKLGRVSNAEVASSTSSATFERLMLFIVSSGVGVLGTIMVLSQ